MFLFLLFSNFKFSRWHMAVAFGSGKKTFDTIGRDAKKKKKIISRLVGSVRELIIAHRETDYIRPRRSRKQQHAGRGENKLYSSQPATLSHERSCCCCCCCGSGGLSRPCVEYRPRSFFFFFFFFFFDKSSALRAISRRRRWLMGAAEQLSL